MQILTMLGAFVRRDWTTTVSYRLPFLLELVGLLFNLTLFFYLAGLVDESSISRKHGLEKGYFAFVVIGLAVLWIGETGLTSFASKLRQEQTTGTFEALAATPAPQSLLALGSAAYDVLRSAVLAVISLVLATSIFGLRLESNPASLAVGVLALLGCAALFGALGVAVASFTVVFKQTAPLLAMLLPAVALLSGIYFPVELLPGPLQVLADLSPFTWGVGLMREALLNGETDLPLLLLLLATGLALFPVSLFLFSLALRRARRAGSLAQY